MTLTQITIVTVALLKLFLKIYVYEKYLIVISNDFGRFFLSGFRRLKDPDHHGQGIFMIYL